MRKGKSYREASFSVTLSYQVFIFNFFCLTSFTNVQKLEHITKSSNEASLPVEGIFRFTFKHDDILSGIGIFTNFDKNMEFKTLRMHLSDCKINPHIIDKLEYYCSNTYDFKFIRD